MKNGLFEYETNDIICTKRKWLRLDNEIGDIEVFMNCMP